jgi:hypothetical protein
MAEATPPPVEARPPADIRRYLPWAGIVVAVWATLPKYSGPTLVTKSSTEVVDHIIPGILVFIASVAALLAMRGREQAEAAGKGPGLAAFVAGLVILLAGFWMVATHVPLVAQAIRGDANWAPAIYHSSAAFAVFGFGLLWTVSHWPDLAATEAAERRASSSG